MGSLDFLLLLFIAGICGAVAKRLTGISRGGCIVSVAIGFIGAFFGVFLQQKLGLPEPLPLRIGPTRFPIFWSIIGGVLFSGLLILLTGQRSR